MVNSSKLKVLKFCYLITAVIILGCGDQNKKSETPLPDSTQPSEEQLSAPSSKEKTLLFFGNSLTAGLGLEPEQAFPALIQKKSDSLNLGYTVINAGLSGETTASGENRISWLLNQQVDVFVLELGANDGLRGIPLTETRENLQAIINAVRSKNKNTKIVIAGMQIPPNMGPEYTEEFKRIFPELAEKNEAKLIPFLLENVAGNPALNQADGIHPTAEGQEIVATNVWKIIYPLLK